MTVELSFTEQGNGPAVVILHGLFGSKRNWASIAKALAHQYRVFSLDLRNHGDTPWATDIGYKTMAADVEAFIHHHAIAPCAVIGHSMGGKVAMTLALQSPQLVSRLVVVDIAPVPRDTRIGAYIGIMANIPLATCATRKDVENLMIQPISNPQVRQFLLQNLVRNEGVFCWRLNLYALDKGMKDIAGFPQFFNHDQYSGETLFIKGEQSDYILPEHKAIIDKLFPKANFHTIADAGHWVHAEAQEAFIEVLSGFLNIELNAD